MKTTRFLPVLVVILVLGLVLSACAVPPPPAGSGAARGQAHASLPRYRTVRPLIRGDDLLALGVQPGKPVGEVLARLRAAKLDGEVKTRADEERLVRDGLGRNDE